MKARPLAFALFVAFQPALADFEAPSGGDADMTAGDGTRPWDLTMRASIGHNDNVQLVPDATTYFLSGGESTSAGFFTLQADGIYRFHQTGSVVSGLTLSASSLWHEDKMQSVANGWDFSDYNFYTFNPGIFSSYRHMVAGRPGAFTVSYAFLKEDGHNEKLQALGLSSHNIRLAENIHLNRDLELSAALNLGWDDFEVGFPLAPSMDRDGNRSGFDLSLRRWMNAGLHNITAGIGYINNDSKGQDFQYDGYNLRLRFESGALRPLWVAAELKYSDRDYSPVVLTRTEQQITSTMLQVLWPFAPRWSADLYYRHDSYDSNDPSYETGATQYGAGVSYKF